MGIPTLEMLTTAGYGFQRRRFAIDARACRALAARDVLLEFVGRYAQRLPKRACAAEA